MRKLKICMLLIIVLTLIVAVGCKKDTPAPKPAKEEKPAKPAEAELPTMYPWPYSGHLSAEKAPTEMRPLSVKIENSEAAMPQMGVNAADVVYETQVEGDYTRFNCIFHSQIPKEVGPVRSARLSDIWILPQYQGLLFFSGGNRQVRGAIKDARIPNMSHSIANALYHRVSFKRAPHNLYLDLGKAYDYAKEKRKDNFRVTSSALVPLYYDEGQQQEEIMSAAGITAKENAGAATKTTDTAVSGGAVSGGAISGGAITAANTISWYISRYNSAKWEWDAAQQRYLRWSLGEKHIDAATDEQIYTTNLVVMSAKYTRQTMKDPAGSPTYDTDLGGTGAAIIFKDGQRIDGQWSADRTHPPTFTDKQGNRIPLNLGRTWFEVFDSRVKLTVE